MGDDIDARAIAERIRILIGDQTVGRMELALRLGVTESALRRTIDSTSPRPTLDVLAAVVREYGVDPTWLVFGEYDAATHRVSLEAGLSFTGRDIATLALSKLRRDELRPKLLRTFF